MTTEHEASRTLVKSPPELWAECSDAGSLARHLGEFGEIQITKLDPESTVAWEGEHASGTVRIEPSGWGTRVTLTALTKVEDQPPPPEATEGRPAGELPGDVEPVSAGGESPSDGESPTTQETADATMEATLEDEGPAPVDDTPRARARWRRLTARMRGVFGPREPDRDEEDLDEPPSDEPALIETPELESEPELAPDAEPAPDPEPDPDPEPAPAESELDPEEILASALESLGQAHHRPFSRA